MGEAVHELVDAHRGESVMVVSHGNAMMGLVAELLSLPLESTWSFAFENTSVTRPCFSKSGRLTIFGLNDASQIHGQEL